MAIFPLQVRIATILPNMESTVLPNRRSKMRALRHMNGTSSGWTACERSKTSNGHRQIRNMHLGLGKGFYLLRPWQPVATAAKRYPGRITAVQILEALTDRSI